MSKYRIKTLSIFRALTAVFTFSIFSTIISCGGDETSSDEIPEWMQEQAVATTPTAENAEETNIVQRVAQQFDRRRFATEARDPFMRPVEQIDPIAAATSAIVIDIPDCELEQHPLGETLPQDLTPIALITGTAIPRAMFRTSDEPQAIIVSEGSRLGPSCTSEIREIRENEVIVVMRSGDEALPIEFSISLHNELLDEAEVNDERDEILSNGRN